MQSSIKYKEVVMKEKDMYPFIKDYYEERGFKVSAEVRDIDIIAEKEKLLIGIEMKKNLTVYLLTQAVLRQRSCDLVYIAVFKPKIFKKNKTHREMIYLLKRLSLGLLYVDVEKGIVMEVLEPTYFDLDKTKKRFINEKRKILLESEKRIFNDNIGGQNKKRVLTSYKEDTLKAIALLELYEIVRPKDLKELKINHSLLSRNYYNWFKRKEHGIYILNKSMAHDYDEYRYVIDYFKNEYKDLKLNELKP